MKITKKWLKTKRACYEGVEWFTNQTKSDLIEILEQLIKENRLSWANWLIIRVVKYKQYVSYAVFAAEQVIDIYEKKYPNDDRPRKAIEAAKKCIKNQSKKNKQVAADAAYAAAYAAADAAYAAAHAADAAYAAAHAADAAADAAHAAYAADAATRIKILEYGIDSLRGDKK